MRKSSMVILVPLISVSAWICSAPAVLGQDAGYFRSIGNGLAMGAHAAKAPTEGIPRFFAGTESAVDESGKVPSAGQRTPSPEKNKEAGRAEGATLVPQGDAPKAPVAPRGLRVIRAN